MSQLHSFRLLSFIVLVILVFGGQSAGAAPPSDAPYFGELTFSTGFDAETNSPIDAATSFGSDTVRLYVSWEYEGVTVGTPYKGIWMLDEVQFSERTGEFERTEGVMENSIATTDGLPLPEGIYAFALMIDGEVVVYDQGRVGAAPAPDEPAPIDDGLPDFSPVSVTSEYDETLEEPVGSATQFDEGVTTLYFYCSFENMPDGAPGITTTYHDQEFLYQSDIVFDFPEGMWWEEVENPDGSPLAPGAYSVIFEVDGRPAGIGDCTVGDTSVSPTPEQSATSPRIGEIIFGRDVTDDGKVIGESDSFPAGTMSVWAYFRYFGMQDDTVWGRRWEENGELLNEKSDLVWEFSDDGWLALRINFDPLPLQGEYKLTLSVDGQVAQEATFTVDPEASPAATEAVPPDAWKGSSGEKTGAQVEPETEVEPLPTFGPMRFTTEFDEVSGRPTGSVKAFKPGLDRFYAYANWEGAVPDTMVFIAGTYYNPLTDDEILIYLNEGTLMADTGTWWEEIYDIEESTKFLLPGLYRVTVTTGTEDLAKGQIMISPDLEAAAEIYSGQLLPTTEPVSPASKATETPVQPGAPGLTFGPIQFTTEFDTQQNRPVGSISVLEPGSDHFYAYAEFESDEPGILFYAIVRYVENEDEFVFNSTEHYGANKGIWWEEIKDMKAGELRPGTYRVIVFVDDQSVGKGAISVRDAAVATPVPLEQEETPIGTSPSLIEAGLTVGPVMFSDTYDEDTDEFGPPATTFPAGTERVYARFWYEGLTPARMLASETRVSSPELGKDVLVCSNIDLDYGVNGTWTEVIRVPTGGTLPPGEYRAEFELFTDDGFETVQVGIFSVDPGEEPSPTVSAVIEEAPTPAGPTATPAPLAPAPEIPGLLINPVIFSGTYNEDTGAFGPPATTFPAGTERIYAHFEYEGLTPDRMQFSTTKVSSPELGKDVFVCNNANENYDVNGTWTEVIRVPTGGTLPPGEYRAEFEFSNNEAKFEIVQVGTFTVSAAEESAPVSSEPTPRALDADPSFGPITFCEDVTEDGEAINPTDHFPAGTTQVTALFDYRGMTDGMSWGQLWTKDGKVYDEDSNAVWDEGLEGWTGYYIEEDDGSPLSGQFTLTLFIQGQPGQQGGFRVDAPE